MDDEDDDDDGGEEHGHLTQGTCVTPLNLILVMNMNVKVVLCDCGKAYKLPDIISSSSDHTTNYVANTNYYSSNSVENGSVCVAANNNQKGCEMTFDGQQHTILEDPGKLTEVVTIKDGLKVRY